MTTNKSIGILPITTIMEIVIGNYVRGKGVQSITYSTGYLTISVNWLPVPIKVPIDPYLKDLLSIYMYIEEIESIVLQGPDITITVST